MRPYITITLFILICCSSLTGQVPDSLKYILLHPAEFQKAYKADDKALLVDVREFFEYRKSRIKGAFNIPSSGDMKAAADTLDKNRAVYLYCTSGFRSKRVAKNFYDSGLRRLYSLEGGIMAWRKEGMAVERKRIRRNASLNQYQD